MSKTTPEEAKALSWKYKLRLSERQLELLAALIDEVRGVDAEPVMHQFQDREGKWWPFMDDMHYKNTAKDDSWPIRALYTHPAPSQPVAAEEVMALREALQACLDYGVMIGGDWVIEKPHAALSGPGSAKEPS